MKFNLDRMEVPEYYTLIADDELSHSVSGYTVFTPTDNSRPDRLILGIVSAQTPMGQGSYLGFWTNRLRKAAPEEVLAALKRTHPDGRFFRPNYIAPILLVMSSALDPDNFRHLTGMSVKEARDKEIKAYREHRKLLLYWCIITWRQRKAITEQLMRSNNG